MAQVVWMQLFDGLDIGGNLLADHLDGLAVQRKLSTNGFTWQLVSARPSGPLTAHGAVAADTVHSDAGHFHLRAFEARSRPPIEILMGIVAYRPQGFFCSCALLVYSCMNARSSQVGNEQPGMGSRVFLPSPPSEKEGRFHSHTL